MRLHRLILLFIIIFFTVSAGRSYGTILEWEPFKIRADLALSIPVVPLKDKIIFIPPDEFSEIRDSYLFTLDTDRKSDTNWNRFNFRSLTFTFSHCEVGQFDRNMTRLLGNEQDKWNTIKSLPTIFLHSPYQDTFESIGRIFEPQVNLGIEF